MCRVRRWTFTQSNSHCVRYSVHECFQERERERERGGERSFSRIIELTFFRFSVTCCFMWFLVLCYVSWVLMFVSDSFHVERLGLYWLSVIGRSNIDYWLWSVHHYIAACLLWVRVYASVFTRNPCMVFNSSSKVILSVAVWHKYCLLALLLFNLYLYAVSWPIAVCLSVYRR